jgi:L-fuconolactonase
LDLADLMPPRIDAHHHVWDLAVREQPWMAGEAMEPLRRSFGIDEYAVEACASGISASVVVQTVADIAETEELLDLADASPLVAGVVGWVDVAAPDVGHQLDRLLARPSGAWLVGIRSLVQYEPDPAWLQRPAVIAGLREVARRGLCNELLVLPHQLDAVLNAIGELPDGRFVLDHLGKPAIRSGQLHPWADRVADVAAAGNVWAKMSGLVTEADWATWTADELRPYVDCAIAEFGTDRVVFGSDWPVCTLAASYREIVDLADNFTDKLSTGERDAIFAANADTVYGLRDRLGVTT